MMRIQVGQAAIPFSTADIFGNPVDLEAYRGQKVMLSFYRYASCPFCNLRLHQLITEFPSFQKQGLSLIAIFQSPESGVREQMENHAIPFPVIADPEHQIYQLYGLESSWWGYLRGAMQFRKIRQAFALGFKGGAMDGDKALLPADFLIDSELIVQRAFYGRRIDEHMPLSEIKQWLDGDSGSLQSGQAQLGFES